MVSVTKGRISLWKKRQELLLLLLSVGNLKEMVTDQAKDQAPSLSDHCITMPHNASQCSQTAAQTARLLVTYNVTDE